MSLVSLINTFGEKLTPVEGSELFENNEIIYEKTVLEVQEDINNIKEDTYNTQQAKFTKENLKYKEGEKVVLIYGELTDIFTYLNRSPFESHVLFSPRMGEYDVPLWSLRYATEEEIEANIRLSRNG